VLLWGPGVVTGNEKEGKMENLNLKSWELEQVTDVLLAGEWQEVRNLRFGDFNNFLEWDTISGKRIRCELSQIQAYKMQMPILIKLKSAT
jgi:hypothetical protein